MHPTEMHYCIIETSWAEIPWIDPLLDRDPLDRDLPVQIDTSWTETSLGRPPGQSLPCPPYVAKSRQYAFYWNAYIVFGMNFGQTSDMTLVCDLFRVLVPSTVSC